MKHILQEDRSGCVIACIAMLAEKSYAEVRQLYLSLGGDEFQLKACGNGAGLTSDMMFKVAKACGVENLTIIDGDRARLMIIGSPTDAAGRHCVVIDKNGEKYDPYLIRPQEPREDIEPPKFVYRESGGGSLFG